MTIFNSLKNKYAGAKESYEKATAKAKQLSDAAAPYLDRVADGAGDVIGAMPSSHRKPSPPPPPPPRRPTGREEAALYDEAMEERGRHYSSPPDPFGSSGFGYGRMMKPPDPFGSSGFEYGRMMKPPDPFGSSGFGYGRMMKPPDLAEIFSVNPMEPPGYLRVPTKERKKGKGRKGGKKRGRNNEYLDQDDDHYMRFYRRY